MSTNQTHAKIKKQPDGFLPTSYVTIITTGSSKSRRLSGDRLEGVFW